ncbi:MAG: hypothetical protein KAW12_07120 [Candidatus Aminicenantes bacterium]|nr:hypothetical protein [Candidatus Aminicenantes bacterium]
MIEVPKKPEYVKDEHLEALENAFAKDIFCKEGFDPFNSIADAMELREALCNLGQYRIDIESNHATGGGDIVTLERITGGEWKNVVFKLDKKSKIIGRARDKEESDILPIQLEGHPTAFLISCAVLYSIIDQELRK